ncbi:GNAT family N-acetyltransferase [Paenibacillus protaetiae]|nr:GNAT family N-acetyltransferase [Paenibacillus protaetiae]
MAYRFGPMDLTHAKQILDWTYDPPYHLYSLEASEEDQAELLNGAYYYAESDSGELTGFFCVGSSARVPGGYPLGIYAGDDCLDIGFGLRPDYTGRGHGPEFIRQVMRYVDAEYRPTKLQLVVASFNRRAIRAYEKAGFYPIGAFYSMIGDQMLEFVAMRRHQIQPVLETGHLLLRPLRASDAAALLKLQADALMRIGPKAQGAHGDDEAAAIEQISNWSSQFCAKRDFYWGITVKSADVLIGVIGYNGLQPEREHASISCRLGGTGMNRFAAEAIRAVVCYGLAELGLETLGTYAAADDLIVHAILESVSFAEAAGVVPAASSDQAVHYSITGELLERSVLAAAYTLRYGAFGAAAGQQPGRGSHEG